MNITVEIKDESIIKKINDSAENLPEEVIKEITKEAFKEYFKHYDVFNKLLYKEQRYYGYGDTKKEPTEFFVKIMKDIVTEEDVKPVKDAIIKYILEENTNLVQDILLKAIINLIGAYDFKQAVSNAIMQNAGNSTKIADYIRGNIRDTNELDDVVGIIQTIPEDMIKNQKLKEEGVIE